MKTVLGFSGALLLIAGLCALLQAREKSRVIPGSAVRFAPAHSIQWDAPSRTLRSTGEDPYGYLELPPDSIPIREVKIEFAGEPPHGRSNFYIYQYPANLDGEYLNDSYAVLGKIVPEAGGYFIRWKLGDSKIVRLDLPDDLDRTVEIRQITITSGPGTWINTLLWLCLLAGIAAPLWMLVREPVRKHGSLEAGIFTLLIVGKIILASDLRLVAIGSAMHDDALFVAQADALVHGNWLGDFNERTLTKGPIYSLFVAGAALAKAPLQQTESGLHALACFAFVLALRPLLPGAGARLLLFIILLFDPHTLSSEAVGRVLRSGIQPALTLFTLAGVIGMATRINGPPRGLIGWSLLAGVVLPTFWFSREEGVWLVPSLLLVGGVALLVALQNQSPGRALRVGLLVFPIVLWFAGVWALREINRHYYGAPITVDVKDGAFPRAYGALMRIKPVHPITTVPVPRECQDRAFAVSPAFATLRPELDGAVFAFWSVLSLNAVGGGGAPGEIRGGWYQWALREAAAKAGHYHNAAEASAFWARVADEVNAACDSGRVVADKPRSGMLPRLDTSLIGPWRKSLGHATEVVIRFSDFTTEVITVTNTPEQSALFTRLTHEPEAAGWAPPTRFTAARIRLSNAYKWCALPLTIVAVASAFVTAILALVRRPRSMAATAGTVPSPTERASAWSTCLLPPAILFALLGGALALMSIIALIDVTSFSAVHSIYLAPATPLVLATWILAPAWATRMLLRLPAR